MLNRLNATTHTRSIMQMNTLIYVSSCVRVQQLASKERGSEQVGGGGGGGR